MKVLVVCLLILESIWTQELQYIQSNINFASDIYTEFAKNNVENFLICPLSAQVILSLAAVGARDSTADELTKALHIPSNITKIQEFFQPISPYQKINKKYQLTSANKIYLAESIHLNDKFKAVAQNTFAAEIANINFNDTLKAVNAINEWVESETHNKIKELLSIDAINSDTVAILVNALYFNGEWVKQFDNSYPERFYVTKNETVEVNMMTLRDDFNHYFNEKLNADFLELPLIGEDVVMTIVLPKERYDLSELEQSMQSLLTVQPYEMSDVEVAIPKFTMETNVNIKEIFESLGVNVPFSDAANFEGISEVPITINDVTQKTFIEVSEVGVTAAAATEFGLSFNSLPAVAFYANHPFIYYLRHRIVGVFFVGRYVKP